MSYSVEQIGQLICMPFNLEEMEAPNLSEKQRNYFFRLENFLLTLDNEIGEPSYVTYAPHSLRFRRLCLQEGKDIYPVDLLQQLREQSSSTWEEILHYVSWYNREAAREIPIGMSLEEVAEGMALLKGRLRMRHLLFGNGRKQTSGNPFGEN